jgi:hypothetical protein
MVGILIRAKIAPARAVMPGLCSFQQAPWWLWRGFVCWGGLVIRAMLKNYRPSNLGRVVMVGTPNNGSQVADFLKKVPLYKTAFGPAGQQLVTDQSSFAHIFSPVDFELGIIAGTRTIDPVSSLIIGSHISNDGKVTVESTRLDGAADHIAIAANHTFIPSNKVMWAQALSFLRHGRFHR